MSMANRVTILTVLLVDLSIWCGLGLAAREIRPEDDRLLWGLATLISAHLLAILSVFSKEKG